MCVFYNFRILATVLDFSSLSDSTLWLSCDQRDWRIGLWFPVGADIFIFSLLPNPVWGLSWLFSSGIKCLWSKTELQSPPRIEAENAWSYTSIPPCAMMVYCLVVGRENKYCVYTVKTAIIIIIISSSSSSSSSNSSSAGPSARAV